MSAAAKDLKARVEAIESGYEFMLAYAAKGVSGGEGTGSSVEIRDFLEGMQRALEGLAGAMLAVASEGKLKPAEAYTAFGEVLGQDADAARRGVGLVLAQKTISSQVVDNLNAMIHLRALLTDLFLIDEIFDPTSGQE